MTIESCSQELIDAIPELVAGRLSEKNADAVRAHVERCETCSAEVKFFRNLAAGQQLYQETHLSPEELTQAADDWSRTEDDFVLHHLADCQICREMVRSVQQSRSSRLAWVGKIRETIPSSPWTLAPAIAAMALFLIWALSSERGPDLWIEQADLISLDVPVLLGEEPTPEEVRVSRGAPDSRLIVLTGLQSDLAKDRVIEVQPAKGGWTKRIPLAAEAIDSLGAARIALKPAPRPGETWILTVLDENDHSELVIRIESEGS